MSDDHTSAGHRRRACDQRWRPTRSASPSSRPTARSATPSSTRRPTAPPAPCAAWASSRATEWRSACPTTAGSSCPSTRQCGWARCGSGSTARLAAPERLAVTTHSRARVYIGGTAEQAPVGTIVLAEPDWAELVTGATPIAAPVRIDPHAPAAIAYTSGTTGRQKGALHSQYNLLLPGAMLVETRGWDRTLRKADCLHMTILNMQVLSTLSACQARGTAIISDVRDAKRLVTWLGEHRPPVWNAVPPILFDMCRDPSIPADAVEFIHELWTGGDKRTCGPSSPPSSTASWSPPTG
jgi:non-ribosomal peptide synthetase component F